MVEESRPPYFFSPFPPRSDRPLLIFLPGMDETGDELFRLQTAKLESFFDIRCFVIPPSSLDSWESLSERAIALTRGEIANDPRPLYLCAESFGGSLALEILAREPNLFNGAILINPTSSFPRVPLLVLGSFLLPWTPRFVYELSSISAVFFLARLTRLSPIARKTLRRAVRDAPQPTAVQRLELLREFTIDTARLRRFTEPVLLLGSRGDRLLPSVEEVYRLAGVFPNARAVILPHSGHACLLESDLDLIAILRETRFLPV